MLYKVAPENYSASKGLNPASFIHNVTVGTLPGKEVAKRDKYNSLLAEAKLLSLMDYSLD